MFFDQMDLPNMRLWTLAGEHYYMNEYERIEKIEMQCKFYGESVLVYSCMGLQDVTERFALYNLDRKRWERVELAGSVSSKADVRIVLRDAKLKKNAGDLF